MSNEEIKQCIATTLITWRKDNNISQKKAAKLLSSKEKAIRITRAMIDKWERKISLPSIYIAEHICETLSITMYQLTKGCALKAHSCEG